MVGAVKDLVLLLELVPYVVQPRLVPLPPLVHNVQQRSEAAWSQTETQERHRIFGDVIRLRPRARPKSQPKRLNLVAGRSGASDFIESNEREQDEL